MILRLLFFLVISSLLLPSCGNSVEKNDELNTKSSDNSAFHGAKTTNATGSNSLTSPNTEGYSISIKLTPFIPDYPDLGEAGKQLLATHLNSAVSKIGYGGDGANPRFIIGPDINLLSKNITSTSPTKYSNTYEVSLMICDVASETVFETYTFELKGVGTSPEKAFINAFRDFRFDTDEFYSFLVKGQKKILTYYDQNCEMFIQEANGQASLRNFDAAFNILNNIPPEAKKCFPQTVVKKKEYFQQSLNSSCQTVLASMKAELGKSNDVTAAGFNEPAMAYYQLIDRKSSCFKEAESIYQSYLKKLKPEAKRNWDFKMQQYQDRVKKIERDDQFRNDSTMANFEYLEHKDEMQAKAEIEGNKKLLQKYQYDQLPWLRKVFHLGKYDPFDGVDK